VALSLAADGLNWLNGASTFTYPDSFVMRSNSASWPDSLMPKLKNNLLKLDPPPAGPRKSATALPGLDFVAELMEYTTQEPFRKSTTILVKAAGSCMGPRCRAFGMTISFELGMHLCAVSVWTWNRGRESSPRTRATGTLI
jgi:hypothetical protein